MLTYLSKGFGEGHVTGITSWLFFVTAGIVTAMVATSFGGYASSVLTDDDPTWTKVFAVLIVLVMTALNVVGSTAVARVQSLIVKIVLTILTVFVVVDPANFDPTLLAPSGYPGVQRHRLERGADLLRVPRLRRHHLHRQGPRRTRPSSCRRRCTSLWRSRRPSTSGCRWACSAR